MLELELAPPKRLVDELEGAAGAAAPKPVNDVVGFAAAKPSATGLLASMGSWSYEAKVGRRAKAARKDGKRVGGVRPSLLITQPAQLCRQAFYGEE